MASNIKLTNSEQSILCTVIDAVNENLVYDNDEDQHFIELEHLVWKGDEQQYHVDPDNIVLSISKKERKALIRALHKLSEDIEKRKASHEKEGNNDR